ncbi:MAG: sigma-70 family RNA polymerase sigma factor [Chloroflexi bacterium]|nr:sigma-70 family RNA polymerase sigma factor [Chloroflexota bacterium]
MNAVVAWPPPFSPFPPEQGWTLEQKRYVFELLYSRWQTASADLEQIGEQELKKLAAKLATPAAARRFQRACAYAKAHNQKDITYIEWLDRVLSGYAAFRRYDTTKRDTPDGECSHLQDFLVDIATRAYRRFSGNTPSREDVEDLASALNVGLRESYFYDIPLEKWLWRTARNLISNERRRQRIQIDVDDQIFESLPSDAPAEEAWSEAHKAVQDAIRSIDHQPYRVILLFLYVYENMDNAGLASFFAVPIPRIATWKSRAQAAGREAYYRNKQRFE